MEKTRYFRSANQFNVATNLFSGNILPLTDEKINLSFGSSVWVIFVWAVNITFFFTVMAGTLYFANLQPMEALQRSGSMIALFIELYIPLLYLNLRRNSLRNLISKYNDILIDSNDLKKIIQDTVRPYKRNLQIYTAACFFVNSTWTAEPMFIAFDNTSFTYADFTLPAYLPGEPFGTKVFVAGVTLQILGACLVNFGKISLDIYVSYLIAVLSAQYKYVRGQAAEALSEKNNEEDDVSVIGALQTCIHHHGAVIEASQGLADILSFHVGAAYLTCILKFCLLGFGLVTFESANVELVSYLVYSSVCVVQIYLICSCIQELFDESTSVTRDAFHGNWHARGNAVKRIFCIMETSNQMQCRLTAYGVVELTVPTLAVILSKSYSFCLLLAEFN